MERILSSEALRRGCENVRLAGWVHNLRDFGDVKFLILRDRGGLIQTVVDPGAEPPRPARSTGCWVAPRQATAPRRDSSPG